MTKQVIVVRKDLNMRKGKIAAQVAHASLGVFTNEMKIAKQVCGPKSIAGLGTFFLTHDMVEWFNDSFTKICVSCDTEIDLLMLEIEANAAGLPHKLIVDNGATEFHGVPTATCIAIGPAQAEEIDKITGHLKLL